MNISDISEVRKLSEKREELVRLTTMKIKKLKIEAEPTDGYTVHLAFYPLEISSTGSKNKYSIQVGPSEDQEAAEAFIHIVQIHAEMQLAEVNRRLLALGVSVPISTPK